MPTFRATIGPLAEITEDRPDAHDAFISGTMTFRAATTEDAHQSMRYLIDFMSPGNLWFRVEELPEGEPHDHPGLLSGRGVPHVHQDGSVHASLPRPGRGVSQEEPGNGA